MEKWFKRHLLLLLLSRFSRVRFCATPETAAHQAPPSLGFSRQEHCSGLPFPSPMHESEKWKWGHSVMSDSLRPHGLEPTRLLCPWDFPGKSTGVGCHRLRNSHTWGVKGAGVLYTNLSVTERAHVDRLLADKWAQWWWPRIHPSQDKAQTVTQYGDGAPWYHCRPRKNW